MYESIFLLLIYRAQEGFGNLYSARQSKIDPNERWPCTPCKASEEDRFGAAAASTNSQNLTERGIKPIVAQGITPIVEADKGYDAEELRLQILDMKLFPYISHRRIGQYKSEQQVKILEKHRWKVERGISWLQRKYRRLVVRWERRMKYWEGFLGLGISGRLHEEFLDMPCS